MESVAAERLNKLGKNPSIISTRHDLKRDAAVLKNMIDRATPQPSSDSSSDSDSSLEISNLNKKVISNHHYHIYMKNLRNHLLLIV